MKLVTLKFKKKIRFSTCIYEYSKICLLYEDWFEGSVKLKSVNTDSRALWGLRSFKIIFTWTTTLPPLKCVTRARLTIISGLWVVAEPVFVLNTTSTSFSIRCPLCPRNRHSINFRRGELITVQKKAFFRCQIKVIIRTSQGLISRKMPLHYIRRLGLW